MTGLRRFIGVLGDQLAELEDTYVEGDMEEVGDLLRELSEYVDRVRTGLDDDGVEPE